MSTLSRYASCEDRYRTTIFHDFSYEGGNNRSWIIKIFLTEIHLHLSIIGFVYNGKELIRDYLLFTVFKLFVSFLIPTLGVEIERDGSLGRECSLEESCTVGRERERERENGKNREYLLYRFTSKEKERSSIQKKFLPNIPDIFTLAISIFPLPKFFRVKSFSSLFHHAIEVTRVSSLGKKLTVAPFNSELSS